MPVSAPDSEYEREADRIADQVLRMPAPTNPRSSPAGPPAPPWETAKSKFPRDRTRDPRLTGRENLRIGRAAQQFARNQEDEPLAQRVSAGANVLAAPTVADQSGTALGPGRLLDPSVRAFFEPRFGHDFSRVRVHTDARATESAQALDARAYTLGQHVVFGAGEYAPRTDAGKRLLAHELTHTVQQGAAPVRRDFDGERPTLSISRNPDLEVNRWAIAGTVGVAEKHGENLEKLAKMVDAEAESWRCIRPIAMARATDPRPPDFDERYDRYVSAGDRFDLSNLLASTGPAVNFHILTGDQPYIDFFTKLYPGLTFSGQPDQDIEQVAADGLTPIKDLVILGHAGGSVMAADSRGNVKFSPAAEAQNAPDPAPSYGLTTGETGVPMLPRHCWFTRDASVRAVGCDSADFTIGFARTYLRQGAHITGTTAAVRGVCLEGTQCAVLKAVDFAETSDWLSAEQATATRLEGPFYNTADFHAASHWTTVAHRGILGWGMVRGQEGPGPRPAAALLGETGEQQVAAIRERLRTDVSDQEVRDVLIILRSWDDPDLVASAWPVIGEDRLRRFLKHLTVEHFVEFPLETLASAAALSDETRDRWIRARTRGTTSRRDAALAFFLVLDLDPTNREDMEGLLGQRPARAQRREARIAERIQAALPYDVRVALVEASQEREEAAEPDAFAPTGLEVPRLSEFSVEAAGEVVRQVEAALAGQRLPTPHEERTAAEELRANLGETVIPAAEFVYVAFRWLIEHQHADLVADVYRGLWGPQSTLPAWTAMVLVTPAFDTTEPTNQRLLELIRQSIPENHWDELNVLLQQAQTLPPENLPIFDPTSQEFTTALAEVQAREAAPASDLIVNSLSGGRVSDKEAREAFGAFACLLGLPARDALEGQSPCTGDAAQQALVRGTVQRLEELQVMSPWLEKLFRASGFDPNEPTNAAVLTHVLGLRLPALALSHVMDLVKADRKDPRIADEDAVLAVRIIAAQPAPVQEAIRRELELHPNGDLTARLTGQAEAQAEGAAGELGAQRDFLRASLDDARLWVPEPDGQLSPTLRTLLLVAIESGLGGEVVDLVERHWQEELSAALVELGYERSAPDGPVTFTKRTGEELDLGGGLTLPEKGLLGARLAPVLAGGTVTVQADRLLEFLTEGTGVVLDLEPRSKEKDEEGDRPGTVTISRLADEGMLQVLGKELVLQLSESRFEAAVIRTGGGRIEGFALRYKFAEQRGIEALSSLNADLVELADIVIATTDAVYGLGRVRLTNVAATGDLTTGRPFSLVFRRGPRVAALMDLVFSIYDGLFAIVDLVTERLTPGSGAVGAEQLASAIAARFEQRVNLNLQLGSALLEGLVLPDLAVERVALGGATELDPTLRGLVVSITNPANWDRLVELRSRWAKGEVLSPEEGLELARLEREALGLALDIDVSGIEVGGVHTVYRNAAEQEALRADLEQLEAERLTLQARIDAVKAGAEVPTAGAEPATSSPLAALAAMDDGVFRARVTTLTAIVEHPAVVPGAGLTIPGFGIAGGGLAGAESLELLLAPDGSLSLKAVDSFVQGLEIEASAFGARLRLGELEIGQTLVEHLGAQEGAEALEHFPQVEAGDTFLQLQDMTAAQVVLTIDDFAALAAGLAKLWGDSGAGVTGSGVTGCGAAEYLSLLKGISGRLGLTLSIRVPLESDEPPALEFLHLTVKFINGKVVFDLLPATLPGGVDPREFFRAKTGIDPSLRLPILDVFDRVLCREPGTSPAPPAGLEGMSMPDAVAELARAADAEVDAETGSRLDAIKDYVTQTLLSAAEIIRVEAATDDLTWKVDRVKISETLDLSFQWAEGQRLPLAAHLTIIPGRVVRTKALLTVRPFALAELSGQVKGVPLWVSGLALDQDVNVNLSLQLDPKTLNPIGGSLDIPLSGLSLTELQLLLPSSPAGQAEP